MRKHKLLTIIIAVIFALIVHEESIYATFNINANSASYDANTGILMIYDSQFTSKGYSAKIDRMSIGGIPIEGEYEFNDGFVKIFVHNRNAVNEWNNFSNNTSSLLSLDGGAIIYTYTPPGGINVVIDSPSIETKLTMSVTPLSKPFKLNSFTTSLTSIPVTGGSFTLTASGSDLNNANLTVLDTDTSTIYFLSKDNNSATTNITLPENTTNNILNKKFILYINGNQTNWNITISVASRSLQNNNLNTDNKEPLENLKPYDGKDNITSNIPVIKPVENNNNQYISPVDKSQSGHKNNKADSTDLSLTRREQNPIIEHITNNMVKYIALLVIIVLFIVFINIYYRNKKISKDSRY